MSSSILFVVCSLRSNDFEGLRVKGYGFYLLES